jgi:hypothetical protein
MVRLGMRWIFAIIGGVIALALLYIWLMGRGIISNPLDP